MTPKDIQRGGWSLTPAGFPCSVTAPCLFTILDSFLFAQLLMSFSFFLHLLNLPNPSTSLHIYCNYPSVLFLIWTAANNSHLTGALYPPLPHPIFFSQFYPEYSFTMLSYLKPFADSPWFCRT